MTFASSTALKSLLDKETSSPEEASARREAERERRIARARAEAVVPAATVAAAGLGKGNGAPPELSPLQELSALGELLAGPRWTTDVARLLGHGDGRTVRRWKAGEAEVDPRDLEALREEGRRRAQAILRLVGDPMDQPAKAKRTPEETRAAFAALMARTRGEAQA
ncbi:hypothetical protein SAMN02799631_03243 [Methylobacterium sp. 174MFSha1.1]|uniref:hypothetical protein n=1 Tax=Methylobacterium sp. 174MFSha1.1 TaxID=1502749 RepID=UPI0008E5C57C|nr:hypothetical protein [Methylobacterium sp. 174MFSha1.1]SFU93452.1 hypothetical protein SAMN02799631_03243 [Methylobacterium sp. 174MFSha1.1]